MTLKCHKDVQFEKDLLAILVFFLYAFLSKIFCLLYLCLGHYFLEHFFEILARIMYTGKALGMYEDVNAKVFEAIHKQRRNLRSEATIAAVFQELGVSEEKFRETFNSFDVSSMVQKAATRTRSMQVTGTPQMIVDGRYTVSPGRDIGHFEMLEVVDFLIEKVRAE